MMAVVMMMIMIMVMRMMIQSDRFYYIRALMTNNSADADAMTQGKKAGNIV
jgi:hypothetical protein